MRDYPLRKDLDLRGTVSAGVSFQAKPLKITHNYPGGNLGPEQTDDAAIRVLRRLDGCVLGGACGLARSEGKRCLSWRGPRKRKTPLSTSPVRGEEEETGFFLRPGGWDFDLPFRYWLLAKCCSEVDLQTHQERIAIKLRLAGVVGDRLVEVRVIPIENELGPLGQVPVASDIGH